MKKEDVGQISTFRGRMHRMLEVGKSLVLFLGSLESSDVNSSQNYNNLREEEFSLMQMERNKAESIIFWREIKTASSIKDYKFTFFS